jgi:acyl dehydratase
MDAQAENLFGDMEFLASQGHHARLAPGIMTASVADALIVGSGILEGFAIAMIGIDGLNAKKPVYAGDTIHVEFEVQLITGQICVWLSLAGLTAASSNAIPPRRR